MRVTKSSPYLQAILLIAFVLSFVSACQTVSDHAGPDPGEHGQVGTAQTETVTELVADLRWASLGFVNTHDEALRQAEETERRSHIVDKALPALDFNVLSGAMLGEQEIPVISSKLRALVGKRVRIKGYALPLDEALDAKEFALHEDPFVQCLYVPKPATNQHLLVRLADGVSFDFDDSPMWVDGILRIGQFETFESGDLALFALDDARYELLPPERMDLPVVVAPAQHNEVHLHARP